MFNELAAQNLAYETTPTSVTCYGLSDGQLLVHVTVYSGGDLTYTLTGPTTANATGSNTQMTFTDLLPGLYTIAVTDINTTDVLQKNIEISSPKGADFTYSAAAYCKTSSNPIPQLAGTPYPGAQKGTFSSTTGLVINSTTGEVNLASSAAGTYLVKNIVTGLNGCPDVTGTATITVTALPVASFTYAQTVCKTTAVNPRPMFTNSGRAGTFSRIAFGDTAKLYFVDVQTGEIDLSRSSAGSFAILNQIAAQGGCPAVSAFSDVDIRLEKLLSPDSITGPDTLSTGQIGVYGAYYKQASSIDMYAMYTYTATNGASVNDINHQIYWNTPGQQIVTVQAKNSCGIGTTQSKTVIVKPAVFTVDLDADNSSGLTGSDFKATYTENGSVTSRTIVDTDRNVLSPGGSFVSATIVIENPVAGDVLSVPFTVSNTITTTITNTPGISEVTFSNTAGVNDYRLALGCVTFMNTTDNPTNVTRKISVTFTDGTTTQTAYVYIYVIPVNDAPIVQSDHIIVAENTTWSDSLNVLLVNDRDPDKDTLIISSISKNGTYGVFTINNKTFSYTPDTDFTGNDVVIVTVCDPSTVCKSDTVFISVPVNHAPVVQNDHVAATKNTILSDSLKTLLINDSDPDNDMLSVSSISKNGTYGVFTVNNKLFSYIPDTDFTGNDTVIVRVCDPSNACKSDTVFIRVDDVAGTVTGIENGNTSHIKLHPNPVSSILYIDHVADKTGVSLYNMSGQLVLSSVITSYGIDVSKLEPGIYFVKIADVDKAIRIVKE